MIWCIHLGMADDDTKKGCGTTGDELMAGPVLPGGYRPFVRHKADHEIVAGLMRPVKEGEMLHEGAFHLEHKEGDRYKVTDVFDGTKPASLSTKGPAKVATPAYRANYDAIFGKPTVGQA
jgi:hypothetical protein